MSAFFYVFPDEASAQACLDYINGTPWFPIVGKVKGQPAPEKQATTKWAESPLEMLSGEWCVPRIPAARLDAVGVPQDDRVNFMAAFGQDVRELDAGDFPTLNLDS